jgi:hypothetical protein
MRRLEVGQFCRGPTGNQTAEGALLLERCDAEFEKKMVEVLCVYPEVQVLKKAAAESNKSDKAGGDRLLR